jgi:hypothetical protein
MFVHFDSLDASKLRGSCDRHWSPVGSNDSLPPCAVIEIQSFKSSLMPSVRACKFNGLKGCERTYLMHAGLVPAHNYTLSGRERDIACLSFISCAIWNL